MTETFFTEIRTLVAGYPPLDLPLPEEGLAVWYRALRGEKKQTITYPRVVVFAGSHAGRDIAPVEAEVQALAAPDHPTHRLCAALDTDFSVHELALEAPVAGGLRDDDCAQAVAYGMMMVDEVIDVIGVAAFGAGTEDSAARILAAVGREDPLRLLQQQGGREIAAAFGVILAARLARVPVVAGGAGAHAAAALVQALREDAVQHCLTVAGADGPRVAAEGVGRLQEALTSP